MQENLLGDTDVTMAQVLLKKFQVSVFCDQLKTGLQLQLLPFSPIGAVLFPDLRRFVDTDEAAYATGAILLKIGISGGHTH